MLTKNQLVIIGIIILIALGIGALLFFGTNGGGNDPQTEPVALTAFGTEDPQVFQKMTESYRTVHPNVTITYQRFPEETYEKGMVDALAAGKGPDIVMIRNDWLAKHKEKLAPANSAQITPATVGELFPKVVGKDYTKEGNVYALPLYLDTLALFYNKDIFDAKGVPFPPNTWESLVKLIPKIKETNTTNQIEKSAVALSGSKESITNIDALVSLLMMQFGSPMTDQFGKSMIANNEGSRGLAWYLQFGNPREIAYTWSNSLGNDKDAFAAGRAAMMFGYAEERKDIAKKNPFINMGVGAFPQFEGAAPVTIARYWGMGVTSQSRNAPWAWDFVIYTTTNVATSNQYLEVTERPPALRAQIETYLKNPNLKTFASQALTATSWHIKDPSAVPAIFSRAIEAVTSGKLTIIRALEQAQQELNSL